MSQPRTPISPPESPTSTLSFTTSGAIVIVSPLLMSASFVRHTCLPVFASTRDGVAVEHVEDDLAAAVRRAAIHDVAARSPARGSRLGGAYSHFAGARASRDRARYSMLGYGVDDVHSAVDNERLALVPVAMPVV